MQTSAPILASLALVFIAGCGSPPVSESLAKQGEDDFEFTPSPKPRPTGLAPPTEAEFKAWDRKDPEGEKHLYKWDKDHIDTMLHYWEELECFREVVKAEGEKAFGAEPGTPGEEQWMQFKKGFVLHADGWQKRLLADQPRILEKSKFMGNIFEAHELIINRYPIAYNKGDKTALAEADAHWVIVDAKVRKYTKNLGVDLPERESEKDKAAHAKVCEEAMKPPKRDEKRRRVGPI
jgi:hypothetical protein